MNEIVRWNGCPTKLQEKLAEYLITLLKKIENIVNETIKFIAVAFDEDIVCVFKDVKNGDNRKMLTNKNKEVFYSDPNVPAIEALGIFKKGKRSSIEL